MEDNKLRDYSGPFGPEVDWDSFPRETLVQALKLYSNLFIAVDGFWFLSIKDLYGEEDAIDRDFWVWERYFRYEVKRLRPLLGITGDDVESFLKLLQFSAWIGNIGCKIELTAKNHGVLRAHRCPTLEALIREGEGREHHFCERVEQKMLEMHAHVVNPNIVVSPVRMPPETIGDETCCEWEFRMAGGNKGE